MSQLREAVGEAVARGDLDRLVRLVGDLCAAADWEGVVLLRDRSRAALERGLQLWPAAEYAEYRLALEAPGRYAGPVVVEGAGRFALGPLWEVAAEHPRLGGTGAPTCRRGRRAPWPPTSGSCGGRT